MEKISGMKGWWRLKELLKLATQQMDSPSPVLRLQGREEWMELTHVLEIVWSHVWKCVLVPQLGCMESVWVDVQQGVRSDGTIHTVQFYTYNIQRIHSKK